MNTSKLREKAQPVFNAHPHLNELIATEDGNFFTPTNMQHAKNHAKTKGIKWGRIYREEKQDEDKGGGKPIAEMTVTEATEWAEKQDEIPTLEEALVQVDTKGGKLAIENRIETLKQDK